MSGFDRMEFAYFHEREFESREDLEEWFEWELPEQFNIAESTCHRWANRYPNRPALHVRGRDGTPTTYSYGELDEYANRFANFLRARSIGKGDRIAINGAQRVESLVGHMTAFKLGAVSIPLTVLLGTDGLRYRLEDSNPAVFLAAEDSIETVRNVRGTVEALDLTVTYDDFDESEEIAFWDAISDHPGQFETVSTAAEDPAFVVYTSGTTGEPKGVLHAHRHVLGELPQVLSLQRHDTSDEQVVRTVAEWSWIMSLPGIVLPALFYGMPVVGAPSGGFDPEREFALVDQFGITHLNLPPTAVRMMMQVEDPVGRYDLTSLQSFTTGGESADEGIIAWVEDTFENAEFMEGYGSSEIGGLICDDPAMGYDHRIGSFGIPSVGHETAILDRNTGEEIDEPDVIGELAVRYEDDPSLFLKYLNKPARTDAAIEDGWFLTDDLVSRDEDGYLRFHSRADDLIISSGYRIAPKEIEEALLAHEAVQNVGVIGIPDATRGEIPKAYIEPVEGIEPDDGLKANLQDFVKNRLAKHKYPREIAFTENLPKTTTGKVRRQSLRKREGVDE